MIQTSQHYWFGMFFVVEKTESVIEVLKENNIHNKNIPNNMSNYYQPLDLTTNNWAKEFLKTKFSQWYSEQIQDALDSGKAIEDIEVKVPLSVMKPLHGCWLIEMYNELTSARCKKVIKSGWERQGILDAITWGSKNLPKLDPFADIDLLEYWFPETEEVQEEYEHDKVEFFDKSSGSEWEDWLIFSRMTIERAKLLCYLFCYSFVNHILYFNVKDR